MKSEKEIRSRIEKMNKKMSGGYFRYLNGHKEELLWVLGLNEYSSFDYNEKRIWKNGKVVKWVKYKIEDES
jgi:hypothetical protein